MIIMIIIVIIITAHAVMLARSWSRNSVHPSIRLSHACFVRKNKQRTADILIPRERAITLVY